MKTHNSIFFEKLIANLKKSSEKNYNATVSPIMIVLGTKKFKESSNNFLTLVLTELETNFYKEHKETFDQISIDVYCGPWQTREPRPTLPEDVDGF